MAKVVVKKIEKQYGAGVGAKRTNVTTKRVRDAEGKLVTMRVIDAGSDTLTAD